MDAPDVFAVPRRFDLATVLVAMTGFALLFTGLLLLDASPQVLAGAAALFSLVAVAQAIAIRWEKPREASIAAGVVFFAALAMAHIAAYGPVFTAELMFSPLWGAFAGYVVGTLVGGVFLVSYHLRAALTAERWLRWLQAQEQRQEASPWSDSAQTDQAADESFVSVVVVEGISGAQAI